MESPPTPLLDRLCRKRVMSVQPQMNGMFRIVEHCDGYFEDEFTTEELTALAGELLALAASVT